MKKIILIVVMIVILIIGIYYYYERKTKEVILLGEVVGLEINDLNLENNLENEEIILTSSTGVGTITCVDSKTNEFVALGHSISKSNKEIDLDGRCYKIIFDYIEKWSPDEEGRIIAQIDKKEEIGSIESSNQYGLFGEYTNSKLSYNRTVKTANRFDINRGEAYILLNLDGKGLEKIEVEITRINYFNKNQNIKILVKSDELINNAGGIVKGMSGAPIIQNEKLIGAINCVNPINPVEAYGIFIDKLIN